MSAKVQGNVSGAFQHYKPGSGSGTNQDRDRGIGIGKKSLNVDPCSHPTPQPTKPNRLTQPTLTFQQ